MAYRRGKTRIRTAATGSIIVFGILATIILSAVYGNIGLFGGILATVVGLIAAHKDAREKISNAFNDNDHNSISSSYRAKDSFEIHSKMKGAGNAGLGKFLFGDSISGRTKYTRKK